MATAKVQYEVSADTSRAKKELDEINRKAKEVQESAPGAPGNGGAPSAPAPSAGPAPSNPQQPGGPNPSQPGGKEAADPKKLGETAGKAIASFFIGTVVSQGINFGLAMTGDPLNRTASRMRTEGALRGAGAGIAGGAALGATIGSIVPGLGTAIGGLIGAGVGLLGGAAGGYLTGGKSAADAQKVAMYGRFDSAATFNRSAESGASSAAFQAQLGLSGSREKRMELLLGRYSEIVSGSGNNSVANLDKAMLNLERSGRAETAEYRELAQRRQEQMAQAGALRQQYEAVRSSIPTGALVAGSDVADSYKRMGLEVGAQVDVASVNERQLSVVEEILALLRSRSDGADETRFGGAAHSNPSTFGV